MSVEVEIQRAEESRCRALVDGDLEALDALLTEDLVHIHGNGGTDGKSDYLRGVEQKYVFHRVSRGELLIRCYGNVAVVTGALSQTISIRGSDEQHPIEAMTTQTWLFTSRGWQQNTCHNQFLPHA